MLAFNTGHLSCLISLQGAVRAWFALGAGLKGPNMGDSGLPCPTPKSCIPRLSVSMNMTRFHNSPSVVYGYLLRSSLREKQAEKIYVMLPWFDHIKDFKVMTGSDNRNAIPQLPGVAM